MQQKIAFYLPNLAGGGAERVFVNIANACHGLGHKPVFILDREEGDYLVQLDYAKTPVVALKARKTWLAIPKLRAALAWQQPTMLVSGLPFNNFNAVWMKRYFPQLFVVASEHNYVSRHSADDGLIKRRLTIQGCQRLYPQADAVVCVSQGVREDLAAIVGQDANFHTIYNAILPDAYQRLYQQPVDNPVIARLPKPLFMAAGRLSRQKGFDLLLEAFALYKKQNAKGTLVIFGQGEEAGALKAQAGRLNLGDAVYFAGFADDLFPYYAIVDVFVLSSRWEGFGNVLVEAMAGGASVVSFNCPSGPAEILDNGRFGALVAPEDTAALAKAMYEALYLPAAKKRQVQARAEDFRSSIVAQAYLALRPA